jgi:hypothetical protein
MKISNNIKIKRAIRKALKPEYETIKKIHSGNTKFYKAIDKGYYGISGSKIEREIDKFLKRKNILEFL